MQLIVLFFVCFFLQIFGVAGYNCEYPVEKLMRDAKIFQVILLFTDIILPCLKSVSNNTAFYRYYFTMSEVCQQLYCWLVLFANREICLVQ